MLSLAFSQKSLDVQKGVVVEEFKQRYLNQPYGDAMHHLRYLSYTEHPYRWPTIGLNIEHIEEAEIEDVKNFFFRFYTPNNAILVVAGNVEETEIKLLAEKWFGPIPKGEEFVKNLPVEPLQSQPRRKEVSANVPMSAIYKSYHMSGRMDEEFYVANLLTDILGHGKSSRLVNKLVKEYRVFHSLNAYVTGSTDPGLLIIEGKVNEGISIEDAETKLMAEIFELQKNGLSEEELQKVKNQSETALAGADVELLHRALNLAYFTLLGNPDGFEQELEKVGKVSKVKLEATFKKLISPERENTLIYRSLSSN
jgi:zinc protease